MNPQLHAIKNPHLRFLEFNQQWQEKSLGDIATFHKGNGISKEDISEEGKYSCIRYGELYTTYGEVIKNIKSKTNVNNLSSVKSMIDDLLIPSSGETELDIAKTSCLKVSDVLLGGDINVLRINGHCGEFYAYYLSNYKKRDIAKLAQGNAVVHLYSSHLKSVKVKFPSLQEQQKIASFLSSIDEWIENLRLQKEFLEKYKKGMMKKLFSQQIRFKDENGKEFPEWEEKKIGELVRVEMGQSPSSETYNENENGVYLIQGNADLKDRKTYPRIWTSKPTKLADKGDLIMTVRAPVGYLAKCMHKVCIGRGVAAFKPKKEANISFVYQLLLYNEKKWAKYEQGSTFTAINTRDINHLRLLVPSILEQEQISSILQILDDEIELNSIKIAKVKEWKKGLMQKMFI